MVSLPARPVPGAPWARRRLSLFRRYCGPCPTVRQGEGNARRNASGGRQEMAAPSFETLLYSVEDGIATVTLNRPDKLNAFNTQMMKDMIAAFDETDRDDAVRAVIVSGAGRAFCAGADLSSGAETFDYDKRGCGRPS